MTDLHWTTLRDRAIRAFNGELPTNVMDGCLSGRKGSPAKREGAEASHEFESRPVRMPGIASRRSEQNGTDKRGVVTARPTGRTRNLPVVRRGLGCAPLAQAAHNTPRTP